MGTHPRERVRTVTISTPANTAQATPQSTNWTVGFGLLERVDIVIPAGHVGLTGIQLLWGARQVVPYDGAEFLAGNDDEITVELGLWVQSGVLVVRTFNTDDTFPHAFLLRSYVTDIPRLPPLVAPAPVGALDLSGEVPELPELPAPGELTFEEEVVVAEVFDQFLSDLSTILDGFLSALQTTLSGVAPEVTTEPPPEEAQPPAATGAQDGEDHHHHKHGEGPHAATLSHKRSPAHPGHHHWWGADVPPSDHHPHVHTHVDGTRH